MSSIRYTVAPTSNFQSITKALHDYAEQTGMDLANHPSAMQLELLDSPDAILQMFQERENAFRMYRNKNRTLIDCLRPAVNILHVFSGVTGEAASLVSYIYLVPLFVPVMDISMQSRQSPFSPAKAIFVGIDALLTVRTIPNVLRFDPP